MKEVLTKKFWQDVKKTFDDALEGPPPNASETPPSAPAPKESSEKDAGEAK